jgi:hypothetical protein
MTDLGIAKNYLGAEIEYHSSGIWIHQRTKHIEIQAHFIREQVKSGDIDVNYIPTSIQQADFLTKPLAYSRLSDF